MLLVFIVPLGLFTEQIKQCFYIFLVSSVAEDKGCRIHALNACEGSLQLLDILAALRPDTALRHGMLLILC